MLLNIFYQLILAKLYHWKRAALKHFVGMQVYHWNFKLPGFFVLRKLKYKNPIY